MLIDARSLNQNTKQINTPKVKQSEASELIRQLDIRQQATDRSEPILMTQLDGYAKKSNTDKVDLSRTGRYNLQEIKLQFACDMEYTKETAVTNAYTNSRNSIFKAFGGSGKVSDDAVQGMSKDEFAQYMKSHELDKEINWHSVDMQVWGSCDYDTFTKFTDHLGAIYASLENRIITDFEGGAQSAQLEKLNSFYSKAVNEVTEHLVAKTEQTFDSLGVSMPNGKLENSIRQVIMGKVDAYRSYIAENKDYANIENTDDKWMARDICFMANALKNAYKPEYAKSTDELWSENDILVLGIFGSMYSGKADKASTDLQVLKANDEESLGFEAATRWLKDKIVLTSFNPDGEVENLCSKLFEKYLNNLINNADKAIGIIGKNVKEAEGTDQSQFLPVDKKAVYAVLDVMKQSYNESGNDKTAIIKTVAFARSEFLTKSESSNLWRYNNDYKSNAKNYWRNLYNTYSGKNQSSMNSILKKGEDFSFAINSKDTEKIFGQIGYGVAY